MFQNAITVCFPHAVYNAACFAPKWCKLLSYKYVKKSISDNGKSLARK